jgi:hypothetical protein
MADAIRVEGLQSTRTSLRKLERLGERKEITQGLKRGAELVPPVARPFLRSRTGKMAGMYRAGASGNTAFVRNRHPGAGVQEHGGKIRPKGTTVTIRPQRAVTRALDAKSDDIAEKVGDALDAVFRAAGWR